jgi:hypothetical protein
VPGSRKTRTTPRRGFEKVHDILVRQAEFWYGSWVSGNMKH